MNSLFCRHNRFTADCPICSKGTVLDSSRQEQRPRATREPSSRAGGSRRASGSSTVARTVRGPYVSAGPYDDERGRYEVRLERVPGGVRLASWAAGALERRAPELRAADLPVLVGEARERSILEARDIEPLERALAVEPAEGASGDAGTSAGRAGDLREELRVEATDAGNLRIGRWIYRPNQGWELQEAPVMLPAKRIAEALRNAARNGVLQLAAGG